MECTRCTAEAATGIYLCHACAIRLEDVLGRIPDALTNVQTTVARMDRVAASGGGKSASSRPEAVNVSALDEKIDLTEKIHSWARMVLEYDGDMALRNVEPAAYLKMSVHIIRSQDFAGLLLDELEDAVRSVERVYDKPVERKLYGKCGTLLDDGTVCEATLSAPEDAERIRCRWCGATHSAEARERSDRERVRGELMRPAEVRRHLREKAKVTITPKDMENWSARKRLRYVLARVNTTGKAQRLYRPGDVLRVHQDIDGRWGRVA